MVLCGWLPVKPLRRPSPSGVAAPAARWNSRPGLLRRARRPMPQPEQFDVLVLGGGTGGKLVAWHMARSGLRTAAVERRWVGGSCPNIACMPTKNEIASARIVHEARDGASHGAVTGPVTVDMAAVLKRKRAMVERQVAL